MSSSQAFELGTQARAVHASPTHDCPSGHASGANVWQSSWHTICWPLPSHPSISPGVHVQAAVVPVDPGASVVTVAPVSDVPGAVETDAADVSLDVSGMVTPEAAVVPSISVAPPSSAVPPVGSDDDVAGGLVATGSVLGNVVSVVGLVCGPAVSRPPSSPHAASPSPTHTRICTERMGRFCPETRLRDKRAGAPAGAHAPRRRVSVGRMSATLETPGTLIYETVHGSQAYGLATPSSDVDYKGILVGPSGWYHGYLTCPEQVELGPDHVRYELRKYFRLAVAANPTVLELMWTPDSCHVHMTPAGERLLAERERFLSLRVKDSFSGYAMSQLGRIKTHRKWVMNPPKKEPVRADFGLPDRSLISRDQLGAVEAMLGDGRLEPVDLSTNFLDVLERERRYRGARKEWESYQSWLKTRNPRRSELEARFGYDTKHALHLVRLLRMGLEIVATGEVRVRRDDRDDLLGIKAGALTYDALMALAEDLGKQVHAAAATSTLPAEPDEPALDRLCAELVDRVLAART